MARTLGQVCAVALLAVVATGAHAASLDEELLQQLRSGASVPASEENTEDLVLLTEFYQERQMAPVWVGADGASEQAFALANLLEAADEDGLDPDDYGAAAVQSLLSVTSADRLAELELRLSLGLIQITSDLSAGRLEPTKVNPELFVYPQDLDRAVVVRDAAQATDIAAFVAGFRPQQDEYRRLAAMLVDLRAQAAAGGWVTVPEGPTLKPDMVDPRVTALRERLVQSGDLGADAAADTADPNRYDDQLVQAVMRFQERHGLEADGKVGAKSTEQLNVPVEARIRQALLNLERRRWMPDDRGERYVFVNLADFELKIVDGPKTVFDTRVVVGAPYHRTPVFSEEMKYVVINPYWNVPPSISRGELLPKIKADPGYLAERNFELLSDWSDSATVLDPHKIDWSEVTPKSFNYKLRQGPGPGNALGHMKFMFPNEFNVYLHDTPARSLFAKTERSFSHGCIRVEDVERFGAVVLDNGPEWPLDAIQAEIDSGRRTIVNLSGPLSVHITYLTAWVNKDGTVHFRNDIYGRDQILADALLGPRATL